MSAHETEGDRLLFPGDARLRAAVQAWIEGLARERRMSPNTVEAYGRDLRQFLHHLASRQSTPTIPMLVGLKVRDIRAFMAARRAEEVSGRSLMRMLAGLRSFARFLEREGFGTVSALGGVRSPKVPRRLPRPLPVSAAVALTDTAIRAGEERAPWVLARDAAVLALLYGAGLRISEALGLTRRDAPLPGVDQVTVLGKGGKQRMVPILPVVAQAVADYLAACPLPLPPEGPLFVGARGPCRRGSSSIRWPARGEPSACPTAPRRTPCGTPSPPICWPARVNCARSRNSSATPPCPPLSSTPRSMPPVS